MTLISILSVGWPWFFKLSILFSTWEKGSNFNLKALSAAGSPLK